MTASAARRSPRPWWFRLIGWVVALVIALTLTIVIISQGSFGATEHTQTASPPAAATGEPATSLVQQASFGTKSYLVGPAVVTLSQHGAVANDLSSGRELWRYLREDTTLCAHRVNAKHVTLMYDSGGTCSEAISLEPLSGARQWQRTIEAAHANKIVWAQNGFISVDSQKVIVYEDLQGYERFTLDNAVADNVSGAHTTCENIDAGGAPLTATLQRCRASNDEAWAYQVVVNAASDGDPREQGRSYLTKLTEPQIEGVAQDGTTILRDAAGVVYALPTGAADPVPVYGLPAIALSSPLTVVTTRGAIVVATDTTAYWLSPTGSTVLSTIQIVAAPIAQGVQIYLPTAAGIEVRDAVNRGLLRTIAWSVTPEAPAEITVVGPFVGLRDASGLRVLS